MFKYIWIIMIVITLLTWTSYTVYVIHKCFMDTIEDIKSLEESVDIVRVLRDTFANIMYRHERLVGVWIYILAVVCTILFIASLFLFLCFYYAK